VNKSLHFNVKPIN